MLSCRIRQDTNIKGIQLYDGDAEIKIGQYCDDTTMFLKDKKSVINVLNLLDEFTGISGLTLNKMKTEAMWIGSAKNRVDGLENICWKYGKNACIKVLGIKFKSNCSAADIMENWQGRIEKCESIMKSWMYRNIDLMGKLCWLKHFFSL